MEQAEAIRQAEALDGIAVEARWKDDATGGHWLIGGWPHQKGASKEERAVYDEMYSDIVDAEDETEGDCEG